MHSEMHPVWQNPIQRIVRTAHLSVLIIVHVYNTAQNSSDNLPSYLQTQIVEDMSNQTVFFSRNYSLKLEKCMAKPSI